MLYRTEKILKDYLIKESRIRVFTQKNKGIGAARNLGLDNINGDYILFIDADDWIDENYIQNLYLSLDKESDLGISLDIWDYYNENKKKKWEIKLKKIDENMIKYFFENKICLYLWGKIYKKELFKGIKFGEVKCSEDAVINFKILKNNPNLKFVANAKYYYFQSENSLTRRIEKEIILSRLKSLEEIKLVIESEKRIENIKNYESFYINSGIALIIKSILTMKCNKIELYEYTKELFDKDIYNLRKILLAENVKMIKKIGIISMKLFPNLVIKSYKIFRRIRNV